MEERNTTVKQFFGMSQRGDLREAVRGLNNPQLIMLMSNSSQFEKHVRELEELYPQVPSIGCIGMCYDTNVAENGVGIVAFLDGVKAAANVLEQVSVMPIKYIRRLEDDLQALGASREDTICIDFCAGNDACVLTTIHTALRRREISLVGGTGDAGKYLPMEKSTRIPSPMHLSKIRVAESKLTRKISIRRWAIISLLPPIQIKPAISWEL